MKYIWVFLLFFSLNANAQNTWFKLLPGWRANNNEVSGDTLITLCPGDVGFKLITNINYSDLNSGELLYTDTLDYAVISGDTLTSNEYRTPWLSYYDSQTHVLSLGFAYLDSINNGLKWQSSIFAANPFRKLPYMLNHDTFDTKILQYTKINDKFYAIVNWEQKFGSLGSTYSYKLLRLEENEDPILLKQQITNKICAGCHEVEFDRVKSDNQDKQNIFLLEYDQWDFAGGPQSWQADVTKMDTAGNTIWKCRPNNNDSVNTTLFQMVQKSDGNLICAWNNFYHPPHKHPTKDNPYVDVNDSATVWFAEIDYITGKVLWRKNIRKYLASRKPDTAPDRHQSVFIYDAQLVSNNSIVWVGRRLRVDWPAPVYWKYLPVIFKTGLSGNPIWYREYEMYPGDTGDKGMQVYSFTQTPDKGFILTGEYLNYGGQLTNGEFWQKAAILKLDSLGCLQPGCQLADGISETPRPQQLCRVFPNPASQQINIVFPENQPFNWEIRLTDAMGRSSAASPAGSFRHSIPTAHLPPGIYFIHLKNSKSNHYETHKIIISH
ncbi:MAG: T9SS type A sorting domain-containing protein [Bacteroidia bacterium]